LVYIEVPLTVLLLAGLLAVVPAVLPEPHFCCFFCAGAHDGMIPSFPIGPCLLANSCLAPTHELRKFCPGCNGLIHVLCGRVLEEDEGNFKADSVICPLCDPQKQQQQLPQPQPQLLINPSGK
jgi:hypothetical protein